MWIELRRRHWRWVDRVEVIREARECAAERVKTLLQLLLSRLKLLKLIRGRQVIKSSVQDCNVRVETFLDTPHLGHNGMIHGIVNVLPKRPKLSTHLHVLKTESHLILHLSS